ncbi:hypothetical protein CPter91_0353 [Collimonas pratensis]|uniref:Uncharacterized protein n=1 Tax=Collimonas pratensis TaxID=279113 RepID=A0A127PZE7_9BURK|nr:hypothetical protein CPter91_0353 [Collimonas pratensis]
MHEKTMHKTIAAFRAGKQSALIDKITAMILISRENSN